MPWIEYDKGKVESYKLAVQQILNTFSTPSSSALGSDGLDEQMNVDSAGPPTISGPESGKSWTRFWLCGVLITIWSCFLTSTTQR